jgi:TRAP-type C4-dicarboxylate transport system permease small subunit
MTIQNILHNIDENGERWLLLPLYALIVVTIFMEVFRRFALSYSSIWAEEIARYAFIYVSWIGASAAIKERAHIRIDPGHDLDLGRCGYHCAGCSRLLVVS